MTLCIKTKSYGQASYNAPTRYRRNQAFRYYIGAAAQIKPTKRKTKKKKLPRGTIAGATTVKIPFIKKTKTVKHRFGTKSTYGAAELHSMVSSIQLALDTLDTLPENIKNRPIVFYSNSRYVLDGIIKYLPKWKELNWKSIRYVREQEKTRQLNEEYDKRWPNQASLVEGCYKNPLEGTISNLQLWQELDQLLQELDAITNKVHFRKCNRRRHLLLRKRTIKAAKDAIYEAQLTHKWTDSKKHRRNIDLEQKEREIGEDAISCRNSQKRAIYSHLSNYLNLSRMCLPPLTQVTQELLEEEGSTPPTTTSTYLDPIGFASVGQEFLEEGPPSQPPIPGNDHIYVPVETNKLSTRLTPVSKDSGESACYPFKVACDPTSMTTLSLSGTSQTGINKRCDETSIASDDLSVGDYMVLNSNKNDRNLEPPTTSGLQEGVVICPPPTIPYLPGAPLFAVKIEDKIPVIVEKNPHGGINLRKGKQVVYGIRTDLPVYKKHCHDLNWWFRPKY